MGSPRDYAIGRALRAEKMYGGMNIGRAEGKAASVRAYV